jgi:hypothetical protein
MRHYHLLISGLLFATACQQPKKEAEKPVGSGQAQAVVDTSSGAARSTAAESEPVKVVRELYRINDSHHGPFDEQKDRTLLDRYFTKDLADLIWQDRQMSAQRDEPGLLNGDPLYDAQDMEIRNFRIYPAKLLGNKAEVRVGFTNFGRKKEFTFLLDKTGLGWRIGDILYGDGSQFYQLMSGAAEETP